jgi:uncharacterized protein involved in propanediol utilization
MMIINDDSRVVNKLEASLTDDARVIIYNCHMFIVQATDSWNHIFLITNLTIGTIKDQIFQAQSMASQTLDICITYKDV